MNAHRLRVWTVLGLALVLAVALAARLAPSAEVFQTGSFLPTDGDSLYHLRRMQLVLVGWPRLPALDPWIAWPDGGAIPWAAGFDVLGALAMRAAVAAGGPAAGPLGPAVLHLGLALLLVLLTVELVLFLAPPSPARAPAALAAGLVVALVPQGVESTKLGIIDHHVAEALILMGLARWALAAAPDGSAPRRRRLTFEVAGAALSGGAVLIFSGAPLYVALVLPLLAAEVLAAARPGLLGSGAPGLLAGAALAAAGTAPLVAQHGRAWSFGFPSWLQPALLALAAGGLGLAVLASRVAPSRARRLALFGLLGVAALAAVAVVLPALAAEGRAGLVGWLLRRDPWLARVDEFQPMWRSRPLATAAEVRRYLGSPGLLLPLAVPVALAALAPAGPRRALGVAWLCLATFGLALLQLRFGRVAAPWLGVAIGLALAWGAGRLAAWPRRAAVLPLAAVGLLVAADPRLTAVPLRPADPIIDGAVEAGLDLAGWPADPASPGVLAPWDLGNAALVAGGRPVVANGFGSYPDPRAFEEAEEAFRLPEAGLLELARRRRVGVVFAGAANLFGRVVGQGSAIPFEGKGYSAGWLRAVPSAPLLIGGSGVPALGVRHFEHLLPRFASTRGVTGIERPVPVLWGYELVAGARLEGRAAPGARAVLEIPLLEHGRSHTWRAFADAGADGRWAMTVPLPTDLATPTVRTAAGRLRVGEEPARPQAVPGAAVRAGRAVAAAPAPR